MSIDRLALATGVHRLEETAVDYLEVTRSANGYTERRVRKDGIEPPQLPSEFDAVRDSLRDVIVVLNQKGVITLAERAALIRRLNRE